MAFYGSGAGITSLVQGDQQGSRVTTSTNRSLTSGFVTHLSVSRTVPSGHTGHFSAFAWFGTIHESDGGGMIVRCSDSGDASFDGYEYKGHEGFEDHDGGTAMPNWFFTLGPGSYTFSLQAREYNDDVILNYYGSQDSFAVNGFYVRD